MYSKKPGEPFLPCKKNKKSTTSNPGPSFIIPSPGAWHRIVFSRSSPWHLQLWYGLDRMQPRETVGSNTGTSAGLLWFDVVFSRPGRFGWRCVFCPTIIIVIIIICMWFLSVTFFMFWTIWYLYCLFSWTLSIRFWIPESPPSRKCPSGHG